MFLQRSMKNFLDKQLSSEKMKTRSLLCTCHEMNGISRKRHVEVLTPSICAEDLIYLFIYLFIYFCLFRAAPVAHGGSQARSQIRAVAATLHHSHSNAGSLTHWARPGIQPKSSWILVGFVNHGATTGTPTWDLNLRESLCRCNQVKMRSLE